MSTIGIFFGTDTGKTRKVAKLIKQKLGEQAADPVNINRASLDDLLAYDILILGTPTLGDGQLPGLDAECVSESWAEFANELANADLSGKTVALFGLGDQESYPDDFVSALGELYDIVSETGANIIGAWPAEGYTFTDSAALESGSFVGLVLDQDNQQDLTEERVTRWVSQLQAEF
ncbi:flavodoxin [Brenneria tiliae]|uniref:flavodoxin n=1 Tax=Brenneria tiliae TaxID=2914984 RepID=UPI002014FA58|nr:flavodoxin [Brenneria tiliae]MCL2900351.1 flavodoxin [Brenneria tiliae]MCL2904162.1 flavodoxin [Brenneria tiliae]